MSIWYQVFFWSYAPFELWNFGLWNLAKIKYTTETVCHRNSSKPLNRISWNFVVLFKGNSALNFFQREQYTISCSLCETSLGWTTEKLLNQISCRQWTFKCNTNVTIIYRLGVFDNYRLWFSVRLPFTLWAAISSNIGAWGIRACSLFLLYVLLQRRIILWFFTNSSYQAMCIFVSVTNSIELNTRLYCRIILIPRGQCSCIFKILLVRGDLNLFVRVTHEIHEHWFLTNNDDSTVFPRLVSTF